MNGYAVRVRRTSRITAAILAVSVIICGTLIGFGYPIWRLTSTLTIFMVICLAIAATAGRREAERQLPPASRR